jgi:uracil-DNA glycosylase
MPHTDLQALLDELLKDVRQCTRCQSALPRGPRPVVRAHTRARILIVGQAPGTRVHETGIPWNDPSGVRLRQWLDVTPEQFYDPKQFAIIPMGFCYPGRNERGGDLPPRPECAPHWHATLLEHLPHIALTLLVGSYAQRYYLGSAASKTLTDTVRRWRDFVPTYLPTPHPSPRNILWLRKNPWFEAEVIPALRGRVHTLLESGPSGERADGGPSTSVSAR